MVSLPDISSLISTAAPPAARGVLPPALAEPSGPHAPGGGQSFASYLQALGEADMARESVSPGPDHRQPAAAGPADAGGPPGVAGDDTGKPVPPDQGLAQAPAKVADLGNAQPAKKPVQLRAGSGEGPSDPDAASGELAKSGKPGPQELPREAEGKHTGLDVPAENSKAPASAPKSDARNGDGTAPGTPGPASTPKVEKPPTDPGEAATASERDTGAHDAVSAEPGSQSSRANGVPGEAQSKAAAGSPAGEAASVKGADGSADARAERGIRPTGPDPSGPGTTHSATKGETSPGSGDSDSKQGGERSWRGTSEQGAGERSGYTRAAGSSAASQGSGQPAAPADPPASGIPANTVGADRGFAGGMPITAVRGTFGEASGSRVNLSAGLREFMRSEGMQSNLQSAIVNLRKDGTANVRMMMEPAELGRLRIDLRVQENRIVGRILVDNGTVRDLMLDQLAELERSLAEQGFDAVEVEVSSRDDQKQPGDHSGTGTEAEHSKVSDAFEQGSAGVEATDGDHLVNITI